MPRRGKSKNSKGSPDPELAAALFGYTTTPTMVSGSSMGYTRGCMTVDEYKAGYTDPVIEMRKAHAEKARASENATFRLTKPESSAVVDARKAVEAATAELRKYQKAVQDSGLRHNGKHWCGFGSSVANDQIKHLKQKVAKATAKLQQEQVMSKTGEECAKEMNRCRKRSGLAQFLSPSASYETEMRRVAYVIQYNEDGSHHHIDRTMPVKCNCTASGIDPDTGKLPNFMVIDKRSDKHTAGFFDAASLRDELVDFGMFVLEDWLSKPFTDFSGQMLGMSCIAVGKGLLPMGALIETCVRISS